MATEETKPVERDINVEAEEFLLTNYANIRGKWKWLVPILGAFGQASANAALERAAQVVQGNIANFEGFIPTLRGDPIARERAQVVLSILIGERDAIRALKGSR